MQMRTGLLCIPRTGRVEDEMTDEKQRDEQHGYQDDKMQRAAQPQPNRAAHGPIPAGRAQLHGHRPAHSR